ncbi:MAG: ABC transporter ATP-binding protein, partial [Opitutae bacterium]|nr:ABC transporter ATP-binding protein [Opitutae bacterium]
EPTNDLDAETLDLLEDLLVELQGTLLLVSHDRAFLDEVVTSTLVFEGAGRLGDYVGGYTDWQNEKRKQAGRAQRPAAPERTTGPVVPTVKNATKARKLSGKEQRELEALPAKIEALEKEQAQLTAQLADPAFYRKQAAKFAGVKARLETVGKEHAAAFARWEDLEAARTAAH